MNEKTIVAIKESIAHWDRLATGTQAEKEDIFYRDCPLCAIFYLKPKSYCIGCPVMTKTGRSHCDGSPWPLASATNLVYGKNHPEFRDAAKLMATFLRSLLPEEGAEP